MGRDGKRREERVGREGKRREEGGGEGGEHVCVCVHILGENTSKREQVEFLY